MGLSIGVGTWYACSIKILFDMVVWKIRSGGARFKEAIVRTRPP